MNLRELIELGAQKAGSKTALAAHLQIPRALLMDAQAGRSALPIIAADRLAEYTHTDPLQAVYAAEAQRAKDPKKKAYFEHRMMAKAAAIAAIAISLVILEMTPNDAQAALLLGIDSGAIGIM